MTRPIQIMLLTLCLATSVHAQRDSTDRRFLASGYVKTIAGVQGSGKFDSLAWVGLVHNRINLRYAFSSKLQARVEFRNRVFFGSQVGRNPQFAQNVDDYPGYFHLSKLWVETSDLVVHTVVDRAQVRYRDANWEVVLGRQRINWGVNTVWNPNDLFNAYNFLDFDYEERPGNDAIRVRHDLKGGMSLEFAAKPGRDSASTVVAALLKMNKHGYDLQFLGGVSGEDMVVGMGWAGGIGKTGFKGEWSYFHPRTNTWDTLGALSLSFGFDRTLKGDWYLSASYLYTSLPSAFPGPSGVYSATLTAKSLFPFPHAFLVGVMKQFSPRSSLNLSTVYSPQGNSLILFPMVRYELRDDLDLDLTIQSYFSSLEGDYGCRGTAAFLRLKWSF